MEIRHIKGNLFDAPSEFNLAHCISADAKMNAGIAREFVKRNPDMRESLLYNVELCVGRAYPYMDSESSHLVWNLVTKQNYWGKPTYSTMRSALESLRSRLVHYKSEPRQHKLAIPRIGCGLDKLEWNKVENIIREVFANKDIEIRVYAL